MVVFMLHDLGGNTVHAGVFLQCHAELDSASIIFTLVSQLSRFQNKFGIKSAFLIRIRVAGGNNSPSLPLTLPGGTELYYLGEVIDLDQVVVFGKAIIGQADPGLSIFGA